MTTWRARLIHPERHDDETRRVTALPADHFPPQRLYAPPPGTPDLDPNATPDPQQKLDAYRLVAANEATREATYRIVS